MSGMMENKGGRKERKEMFSCEKFRKDNQKFVHCKKRNSNVLYLYSNILSLF